MFMFSVMHDPVANCVLAVVLVIRGLFESIEDRLDLQKSRVAQKRGTHLQMFCMPYGPDEHA